MSIKQPKDSMDKPTFDGMQSNLMERWQARVEKLHQAIKDDPYHAKYRDCEEDNQHPSWEPALISRISKDKK